MQFNHALFDDSGMMCSGTEEEMGIAFDFLMGYIGEEDEQYEKTLEEYGYLEDNHSGRVYLCKILR